MDFLYKSRAEGKRQIKPSHDVAILEQLNGGDESSDDSDFKIDEHENDLSGSCSSDESAPSSSEESSKFDETLVAQDSRVAVVPPVSLELVNELASDDRLICGCCLSTSTHSDNEIVECDSCGVVVHEGCYGITDMTSLASSVSESSTEPWFCDPCLAGCSVPPSCDLCPNLGGLYKRTEVGRWIHVICALYVPGVAFGDPEGLQKATVFEMNYGNWSRYTCCVCTDSMIARTGVCIQCDAGMCKSYFHVTCALSAGLLLDPSFNDNDPYLAHCFQHSDRDAIKKKRRAYLASTAAFERRRLRASSTAANEKTDRQLRICRKLEQYRARFAEQQVGDSAPWLPTQKLPRLLSSSASAVFKLRRLAQLRSGTDIFPRDSTTYDETLSALTLIEIRRKWNVPLAFNVEFPAYYFDRNRRIADMKARDALQAERLVELKSKEAQIKCDYSKALKMLDDVQENNSKLQKQLKSYMDLFEIIFPPQWSSSLSKILPVKHSSSKRKKRSSSPKLLSKKCSTCRSNRDQHLFILCDTCKNHYHLGCLQPPLARHPKQSKAYTWQCADCNRSSSSEPDHKFSTVDLAGPRKLRRSFKKPKFSHIEDYVMEGHPDKSDRLPSANNARINETEDKRQQVRRKIRKKKMKIKKKKAVPHPDTNALDDSDVQIIEDDSLAKNRRECYKCKKINLIDLQVQCNECNQMFDFECLDPPAKRTPKIFGCNWYCDECSVYSADVARHLD